MTLDRDVDYYAIVGVPATATVAEISKAYRKQALKLHPDKNPDNPKAAELFDALKRAKDILSNEETRGKYDALIRAKVARAERDQQKTKKQREMMDKLLAGEDAARKQRESNRRNKQNFEHELARLREEMRQHEAARQERRRKRAAEASALRGWQRKAAQSAVRVQWSEAVGELTAQMLRDMFEGSVGDIEDVVMSKKPREAVLSFSSVASAQAAIDDNQNDADFSVAWLDAAAAAAAALADAQAAGAWRARAMRADVRTDTVAPFEPYRRPQHDDVIDGVLVPQTPSDDSMEKHMIYEKAVLELLRS